MKTKTNHGAEITLGITEDQAVAPAASCSPPAHIACLPQWHRWGPHGGPKIVYECAEQPEYTKQSGTVVVWAPLPRWMRIQINLWYYRREAND